LPPEVRHNLPNGISIAVKYPAEVIRGIAHLPTLEYKQWYDKFNERLDILVTFGTEILQASGYQAVAQTRAQVGIENEDSRVLPHKTVATRVGLVQHYSYNT
jgi:epoxyqueuosine reductase QueG